MTEEKRQKLNQFFTKEKAFKAQLNELRDLLLKTELKEQLKWGIPTYTLNNKNVVGLGRFKNHFGIWFFQGCFLKDEHNLLRNAQEGKTKGMRQLNFTNDDTLPLKIIDAYVLEAIQNQKEGKEIEKARAPKKDDIKLSQEFEEALTKDLKLKQAFENLTPGKQKEYIEHISSAKQEATRLRRLDKAIPLIKKGEGLNDKYKK